MSEHEAMVMSMLACTHEEAKEYLSKTGGDVSLAILQNMKCVPVSGEKYIPPPPKIDDGLTDEVREKLKEARKISEAFSASFRNDLRGVQAQTASAPVVAGSVAVEERQDSQAQIDVGEYS
jgi:hypothetical protein